ncbi:hypothetical protein EK904_008590 [Melospiza melodia maxima]|nr:hypothetical protein EK904_008590 [Melospiza melodia maxima]
MVLSARGLMYDTRTGQKSTQDEIFFQPCPPEHHWKSKSEASFWRKLLRVVQNTGSERSAVTSDFN